ncbi:MAG: hypothetical protein J0I06_19675 [Planctomycetes bacterium]|nr:hypothetical protein [Planctomycetota bacterium]
MISTRDLSGLPDVDALKRLMQSMAVLDAVLCPEWQFRYYSFNSKWAKGEQMGSMRNGMGDDLFALFTKDGCFLKGFVHTAPMTPYAKRSQKVRPGVFDSVPSVFARGLSEPAFMIDNTTFCVWQQYADNCWQVGTIKFPKPKLDFRGAPIDPDGSGYLLSPYDGKAETYLAWARHHFSGGFNGDNLTLDHVRHVYAHKPLTVKLVREINPKLTLTDLKADIDEIGYPRRKRQTR